MATHLQVPSRYLSYYAVRKMQDQAKREEDQRTRETINGKPSAPTERKTSPYPPKKAENASRKSLTQPVFKVPLTSPLEKEPEVNTDPQKRPSLHPKDSGARGLESQVNGMKIWQRNDKGAHPSLKAKEKTSLNEQNDKGNLNEKTGKRSFSIFRKTDSEISGVGKLESKNKPSFPGCVRVASAVGSSPCGKPSAGDDVPFFLKRYPRYCEIQSYCHALAKKFPNIMRVEAIGRSIQGRKIEVVILQKNKFYRRDAALIEAGIHAREWLTNTTVLNFLHFVLHHQDMLHYMDYYIIPSLNPDGYEHTHICNRLWRKNMNPNGSVLEKNWGVDVNRNFPYEYGHDSGSSADCSHAKHRGEHSLSEPEARSLADFLKKYGRFIKLYIAMHSCGSLILHPWGYTDEPVEDEEDLVACGRAATEAMKEVNPQSRFNIGSFAKALYLCSGCSADYVRGVHNIKFAYTVELQRGGNSGFDPPASAIPKVAEEALAGICAMVKHVYDHYFKAQAVRPGSRSWKEKEELEKRQAQSSNAVKRISRDL